MKRAILLTAMVMALSCGAQNQKEVERAISESVKSNDSYIAPVLIAFERTIPRHVTDFELRRCIMEALVKFQTAECREALFEIVKRFVAGGATTPKEHDREFDFVLDVYLSVALGKPRRVEADWLLKYSKDVRVHSAAREKMYQAYLNASFLGKDLTVIERAREVLKHLQTNGWTEWRFYHHPLDCTMYQGKRYPVLCDAGRIAFLVSLGKEVLPLMEDQYRSLDALPKLDRTLLDRKYAVATVLNKLTGKNKYRDRPTNSRKVTDECSKEFSAIQKVYLSKKKMFEDGEISKESFQKLASKLQNAVESLCERQ